VKRKSANVVDLAAWRARPRLVPLPPSPAEQSDVEPEESEDLELVLKKSWLLDALEEDARRCRRDPVQHIEAILVRYFGRGVDLQPDRR
jgi:hypothetical protein